METLGVVDGVVVIIYFLALLGFGFYIMKSKKKKGESESFLVADRNVGLIRTTGSNAATDLGGGFSIGMAGLGFTLGLSGSWLMATSALSAVVVSFIVIPKIKGWADKCKGFTTGDLFERRFDKKTGLMAAILVGFSWWCFVGGQIVASGKLLSGTMGLNLTLAILIAGGIMLAYTALGGLKAVISIDVFQVAILFVGIIFLMIPIGWIQVGGWQGMVENLSASAETAGLLSWGAVDFKTGMGWFLSIFPVWFISIATLQRVIAAKDKKTAKWGCFLTGVPIEWPLFAIGTVLVGMFARVLLTGLTIADAEMAMPTMIVQILPVGIAGLVVAAYIAATMSTADSCLMGPVAIIVNDIYKKRLNTKATDSQMLRIGRISVIILGGLAIYFAYKVPAVLTIVLYAYTFGASGLFFPMLGLLFWRRTTATGAFWSILAGGSAGVIWTIMGEPYGFSGSYAGWIVSCLTLIIVTLSTQHSTQEDIATFFPEPEVSK